MHLPLLLVQDSLLKTKTPSPGLRWIGEDGRKVCSISTQQGVSEVSLPSGACSKVARLTSLTKRAAAINTTHGGLYVYGLLSSGDLFFWHCATGQVQQAKGIPEVATHTHTTTSPSGSNAVSDFFKQRLPQSLGGGASTEGADPTVCSVPSHHRPKIFASSDCSKVVVVLGASQVFLWESSLGICLEDTTSSHNVPGRWSVAQCRSDIPLPSTHSKEAQVTCCFINEKGSQKCHVTFCLVECSSVVVSTLTLRWRGTHGRHLPAAHWNTQLLSSSCIGLKENETLHAKGTLISRYARNKSLLAIAVNTQQQHSRLLYLHPLASTTLVAKVQEVVPHTRSTNNVNSVRKHWVSDLAWSHDTLYLFGCLASGALFVTTRMGPLIKISCQGEGLQLHAANILCLHPHSNIPNEEVNEGEGGEILGSSPCPSFCVSAHPSTHQLLLSSGLRVSVLSLPLNARKEDEVMDCLLASANRALHLLCTSALTHDYAYIRSSTWRLAHSLLDLTQPFTDPATPSNFQISLWDRRVLGAPNTLPERTPGDEEELKLIEQVMNPVMAAWLLVSSHGGTQTVEWRRRAGEVVVVVVRLMSTLLKITAYDDHCEHQSQLLLVLHFYHQFVRVLSVWPNSLHMLRPTLRLTHHLLHKVLASERHAGERNMADTLLILSQTLTSVHLSLSQIFVLRPSLPLHAHHSTTELVITDFPGLEVTSVPVLSYDEGNIVPKEDPTISLRMKRLWFCLHENAKKVYTRLGERKFERESYQKLVLVLNIVQSRLQNVGCDLHQGTVRLRKCPQLYLNGLYLKAVQGWKSEVLKCLSKGHGKKTVVQDLHSILYTYLLHEGISGVIVFLNWLSTLLESLLCPKKQPSLESCANKDITKAKDDISLYKTSKVNQTPKKNFSKAMTIMNESHKTLVPVVRRLFEEGSPLEDRAESSSLKGTSSQESVKPKTVSWMLRATQQVIGSLGRILALETLGCHPEVPPPHKPHAVPPIWTFNTQPQAGQLSPIKREEDGSLGLWTVDTTAQALALGGFWADLAIFASRLRDTRTALLAGVLSGVTESRGVTAPSTVFPQHQIKQLLLEPLASPTSAEFQCHQELLQLAAMTKGEVVQAILEECLTKIKNLTPLFETFVPPQVHLPAPPVFCPLGPQDGEEEMEQSLFLGTDDSVSERQLRQEVAGWVRLACHITSAAGIAYPLLLSLQQEYSKVCLMVGEEMSCLLESLGPLEEQWHPQGPEWEGIIKVWQALVTRVWLLHSRDKLSLQVRSLTKDSAAVHQNQKKCVAINLEILSWVDELNTLCEHDAWRTNLVSCAVTTAAETPPGRSVAAALAKVLYKLSEVPSLLRDKTERLFDAWKNTNITVKETDLYFEDETEDRGINSTPMFQSLFSIYVNHCEETARYLSPEGNTRGSEGFSQKYPTQSSSGTQAATRIKEEFQKFLALFVELTLMRDIQKFPQHTSPVPLLVQFSDMIKRKEFQGMKLKSLLQCESTAEVDNSLKECSLNSSDWSALATPEKKGLFRSLDYTKMLPRGNETSFLTPSKWFKKGSLMNTSDKCLYHIRQGGTVTSSTSSPWGKKFQSPSKKKIQNKKGVSIFKAKSLSLDRGLRLTQQKSAKHLPSVTPRVKVSQRVNDDNTDSPLQKLLCLPLCIPDNKEQLEIQDTLRLLNWIMSRERQLDPPLFEENDGCVTGVSKKVNLNLQTLEFSLHWNYFSKWSHIKDNKSHAEITANKYKKGKKNDIITRMNYAAGSPRINSDEVSENDPVQTEVYQGRIKPPKDTLRKKTQTTIPSWSCDPCRLEESHITQEQEERLLQEAASKAGMKNHQPLYNGNSEAQDKESAPIGDESENSVPLQPQSSNTWRKRKPIIRNIHKGTVDSECVDGGQSLESCSKESPHTHLISLSSGPVKGEDNTEVTPVYSQGIERRKEDRTSDIMSTKKTRRCSDQESVHNGLGSYVKNDRSKSSDRTTTRGHQVKVHAKEVGKQSVPSKESQQTFSLSRVSQLTDVEAPEALSGMTGIALGHLAHPSLETVEGTGSISSSTEVFGKKITTFNKIDQKAGEDTLDDVTLPDSLHASDGNEESEVEPASRNIQSNMIQRNTTSIGESEEQGTRVDVPTRNSHENKKSKYEFENATKAKDNEAHMSLDLRKDQNLAGGPRRWDSGKFKLRPVPVQVRVPQQYPPVEEVDGVCTSQERKVTTNEAENNVTKKTPLKLLTIPKSSTSEKEESEPVKPLQLMRLPALHTHTHSATGKLNKDQNIDFSASLYLKGERLEKVKPLTLPKVFDSHPEKDAKLSNTFSFLNPNQVFAFWKYKTSKNTSNKFKNLKVSRKYIMPDFKGENESTESKGPALLEQDRESLDKGFLDQIKNYADKYKKGNYENIMRVDTIVNDSQSTFHHKSTETKWAHDKRSANQPLLMERVTFMKDDDKAANGNDGASPVNKSLTDDKHVTHQCCTDMKKSKNEKLMEERELEAKSMNERKVEKKSVKERKEKDKAVEKKVEKQSVEERKVKVEDKSINTEPEPAGVTLKTMEVQTTQVFGEERCKGTALSQPLLGCIAQTQTCKSQTSEASVFAEVIVPRESKCVQVGSLPSAAASQTPSPPVDAPSLPSPSTSVSPRLSSRACRMEFQAHSHMVHPHSDINAGFVHIFDTPDEIVKNRLEDPKINKTINSIHLEDEDQVGVVSEGKSDRFLRHATAKSKDNRKESSPYEKHEVKKSIKTERNNMMEIGMSDYPYQMFDSDQLNSDPCVSFVPKEESYYENMNKDQLFEEFCSGRISLEDYWKINMRITGKKEVTEETLLQVDDKSLEKIEKEVEKVAQSISMSKQLVTRVSQLMEETEAQESHKIKTHSYRPLEKLSSDSSYRQRDVNVSDSSRDRVQWQNALSLYRKQGNMDAIIQFLDGVNFENITSDIINDIIECETNDQSDVKKISGYKETDASLSVHEGGTVRGDDFFNKGASYLNPVQRDQHHADLELMRTEEWQEHSPSSSPSKLNFSFAHSRTSSDEFCLSSSGSLLGARSTPTVHHEEKLQQRRIEIQAWIKKQRQKRREAAQAGSSASPAKSPKNLPASKRFVKAASNVSTENMGLTGKQIRERSQEREMNRAKQRDEHQRKREAEVAKLLDDYNEELTTLTHSLEPTYPGQSSHTSEFSKHNKVICSSSETSGLSTAPKRNLYTRTKQNAKSPKKPRLKKYFKDKTTEWRIRQQQGFDHSSLAVSDPQERGRACTIENKIETDTRVEMELYYLKRCLAAQKDRYTDDFQPVGKHKPVNHPLYSPSYTKNINRAECEKNITTKHSLIQSGTFTSALDRISEVASSISETSISELKQEGINATSAAEDSSTDSSWSVPQEVKTLLYGNS